MRPRWLLLLGPASLLVAALALYWAWPLAGQRAEAATTININMGNFWFCDSGANNDTSGTLCTVTIDVGDSVKWTNTTSITPHTATHCPDNFTNCLGTRLWDTGTVSGGQMSAVQGPFNTPGTFIYRCQIHPTTMRATLIVQAVDNDGDTIPNDQDPDDDNDGMPDTFELAHSCLNPLVNDAAQDTDNDGLSNIQEFNLGTDPCDPDTDNDGFDDSDDVFPLDPNENYDTDNDNLGDNSDPDIDNDGTPNGSDPDADGDRVLNVDETGCGSQPLTGRFRPERLDGAFAGVDDDGNEGADEPLPSGSEVFDCDGDGYVGTTESHVFTPAANRDQDPCGSDAWAAELVAGSFSGNKINIGDLASFIAPVRRLNTSSGDAGFDQRWDLVPGSSFGKTVNVQDMGNLIVLKPPMLGGMRAYNGPVCPWPP